MIKIFQITILMILMLAVAESAFGAASPTEDIMKIGMGARPIGMGRAGIAVCDDLNSIFLNPAGLSKISGWQFTSMYASMFEGDLNYILVGAGFPLEHANIGLGIISTGTSGIPSPTPTSVSYFDYSDKLYVLSFAPKNALEVFSGELYAGANLKYFSKGFTGSTQESGAGISADLGFQYIHLNGTAIGVNIQNFLPSSVSWQGGANDVIPMLVKVGAAKRFFSDKLTAEIDAEISPGRNLPVPLRAGVEYTFNKNFALRGGIDQSISAQNSVTTNPTAGAGIFFGGLKIDYAYHAYGEGAAGATHFVSLSLSQNRE